MLKILHLSTYDVVGGAAKAAMRLHLGLLGVGADSEMRVRFQGGRFPRTSMLPVSKGIYSRVRRQIRLRTIYRPWERRTRELRDGAEVHLHPFSWYDRDIAAATAKADVVHLHWGYSFFDWPSILKWKQRPPMIITLHDLHPITGGCVYPQGCFNFKTGCGNCHQLRSPSPNDQSARLLDLKHRTIQAYGSRNVTLLATTPWVLDMARASTLGSRLDCECIPLGLDLSTYSSSSRRDARLKLGIEEDIPVIIGVAHRLDTLRKGWQIFAHTVNALAVRYPRLLVLTAGESNLQFPIRARHRHFDFISSESDLADCYAAADLMLAPSLEEAFGQTVIEAMASGTPVLGSDTWGPSTIIEHGKTGFLARTGEVRSFIHHADIALSNPRQLEKLGQNARLAVGEKYSQSSSVQSHLALYQKVAGSDYLSRRSAADTKIE